MTISGYCGQVAHVEVEPNVTTCVSNFVKRLRVRSEIADSRFVFHQMNTDAFRAALSPFIRGTTMQNLSLKDAMSRVELTLPSIDEQRRIAAILDKADEVRAKRRAALETLETLSQAVFIDMFGEISPSWPLVSIESLASTVPGAIRTGPFGSQLLHSEFVDSGIAVLGIDNAVQDHFAWAKPRFITNEKYESLKRFTVRPGDVLVTIMGTCGRSAIVPDDMPVAINTKHLCCITLDQTKCLPTFLAASFRNDGRLRRQLGAEARGAVMPGLNMGLIRATRLYLPPIELQARFARRMDEVGDQEYTQTEHATAIDNLFASLQQRAFQGAL
jgi:type I restriction enzyme S subunit